ncbi:MAG: hypothetical protein BGO67_03060 [Alphaproteobacteria bacterium 41-28]|nr:MAG: hypothetical protein BGO67_03060 [Alphaproteobacteria bacterium 41-28]
MINYRFNILLLAFNTGLTVAFESSPAYASQQEKNVEDITNETTVSKNPKQRLPQEKESGYKRKKQKPKVFPVSHEYYLQTSLMLNAVHSLENQEANHEIEKSLRLEAEAGNSYAQCQLALMYEEGQGVEKDEKEAIRLYHLAADQGHSEALSNLALMYQQGRGVKKDERKAVELYSLAVEQGQPNAQYNLALMYFKGQGVGKDEQLAVKLFKLAAAQGVTQAEYMLSMLSAFKDNKQDEYEVVRLNNLATDLGYVDGQDKLALKEKSQSPQKAKEDEVWLDIAAKGGDSTAQYKLALMYEEGNGVEKDLQKAIDLYRQSASQGNVDAIYNLEICLAAQKMNAGTGLPPSLNKPQKKEGKLQKNPKKQPSKQNSNFDIPPNSMKKNSQKPQFPQHKQRSSKVPHSNQSQQTKPNKLPNTPPSSTARTADAPVRTSLQRQAPHSYKETSQHLSSTQKPKQSPKRRPQQKKQGLASTTTSNSQKPQPKRNPTTPPKKSESSTIASKEPELKKSSPSLPAVTKEASKMNKVWQVKPKNN